MAFNIKSCASLFLKRKLLAKVKIHSLISRDISSNGVLPIPRSWLKKEIQSKYHDKIQDVRPRWDKFGDDTRNMIDFWPEVLKDLSYSMKLTSHLEKRLKESVEYNLINGINKNNFYKLLVRTYKLIPAQQKTTEKNIHLAEILGLCVQLNIENTIIEDYVLDNGVIRCGKPTWYLKNNKDLTVLRDGHLINQSIYQLLKIHFSDKSYYVDLIEIFHEMEYKMVLYNILHKLMRKKRDAGGLLDLKDYTMERWECLNLLKTEPAVAPFKLAIVHAGIRDPEVFKRYNDIAKEIMKFLAFTNDFVDCYGDPEQIGKIGTDIAKGTCSFLIAIALKHATPKQRKILQENYGIDDPQKIARVYEVYEDMNIVSLYCDLEKECMNLINDMAMKVSTQIPPQVFTDAIRADVFTA